MEPVVDDDHPLAIEKSTVRSPLSISTSVSATPYSSLKQRQQEQQQQQHYRSYRTPSASLIQSAVRSILDDATPSSTIVSDDQSETSGVPFSGEYSASPRFWSQNQQTPHQRPLHESSSSSSPPTLESLKTEPIPPIPDKQDRKRFIVSYIVGPVGRRLFFSSAGRRIITGAFFRAKYFLQFVIYDVDFFMNFSGVLSGGISVGL